VSSGLPMGGLLARFSHLCHGFIWWGEKWLSR
jgi:hypothetical protein